MQVQVHHVDAEVAGAHLADQRVHVGAIHVEQAALGMQDVGDFVNLLLEHAQGVGIGQHQSRDILVHLCFECGDVDHAARIRLQILNRVVHHGGRGGIGSVRGIRNQNLLSRVAFGLVIGANHEQAGHLAMGAGGGLQRDRIHPRDLDQLLAQRFDDVQRALRNLLRLVRMPVRNSIHPRHGLVYPRVVLHRARAERVHTEIDGIVPSGHSREMADDLDLAHFRHVAEIFSFGRTQQFGRLDFRHVERRQLPGGLAS